MTSSPMRWRRLFASRPRSLLPVQAHGAVASTPKPTAAPSKNLFHRRFKRGRWHKACRESRAASKVSKVGEKSAPSKPHEEENKLSPSERRKKVLREYYRSHIDPVGRIVAEELAKLKDEETIIKQRLPQTLVMEELEKPRQAYIFQRGIYKNRGENVNPATPAVLPPMPKGAPRNRLGLAQWLVSKSASADRARPGQPHLAAVFRSRNRQDGGGLRHPRRAPHEPRAARLSRHRAGRQQVGPEETPQANRVIGDLSPGVDDCRKPSSIATRKTSFSPAVRGFA